MDKPIKYRDVKVINTDRVDDDDISQMIDDVLDQGCSESFVGFLESLRDFYDRNNYLTSAQYDALERAWHRSQGGQRWHS